MHHEQPTFVLEQMRSRRGFISRNPSRLSRLIAGRAPQGEDGKKRINTTEIHSEKISVTLIRKELSPILTLRCTAAGGASKGSWHATIP